VRNRGLDGTLSPRRELAFQVAAAPAPNTPATLRQRSWHRQRSPVRRVACRRRTTIASSRGGAGARKRWYSHRGAHGRLSGRGRHRRSHL